MSDDARVPDQPQPIDDATGAASELSEGQLEQVTGGLGNFAALGGAKASLLASPKKLIDGDDDDPRLP